LVADSFAFSQITWRLGAESSSSIAKRWAISPAWSSCLKHLDLVIRVG